MGDETDGVTPEAAARSRTAEKLDRVAVREYDELRTLARRLKRRVAAWSVLPGTNSLVHETYLRLKGSGHESWNDRTHFLAVATLQLRHVLVDHVRAAKADKRGGDRVRVSLDENANLAPRSSVDALALDEALNKLALHDARQHRVAELRLFGGLSVAEIGAVVGVSERTVKEDWRQARAWLAKRLRSDSGSES